MSEARNIIVKEVCVWQFCDGIWLATCGMSFHFMDKGPKGNSFYFCPKCGNRLEEK